MTNHTEPESCCAACGRPKPTEFKQQTPYHVSFIAPAGIYRDVINADTAKEALAQARIKAENPDFGAEEFEPVADSYCIQQITAEHPHRDEDRAIWINPDSFAQLHADEILELLEGMIELVDQLDEDHHSLITRISDVVCCGEGSARALKDIRKKGGAL